MRVRSREEWRGFEDAAAEEVRSSTPWRATTVRGPERHTTISNIVTDSQSIQSYGGGCAVRVLLSFFAQQAESFCSVYRLAAIGRVIQNAIDKFRSDITDALRSGL